MTITQTYMPVTHSNGRRLVQITTEDGIFCGWADGAGKYDYVGSWEIDAAWSPEQSGQYAHCLAFLREVSTVIIQEDGVARHVTSQL
jgi:hypothetical protein